MIPKLEEKRTGFGPKSIAISVFVVLATATVAAFVWHGYGEVTARPRDVISEARTKMTVQGMPDMGMPMMGMPLQMPGQLQPQMPGPVAGSATKASMPSTATAPVPERCISCVPQHAQSSGGCTLDNGKTWLSCPAATPYFAVAKNTCVAQAIDCFSKLAAVTDCVNCYNTPCTVAGKPTTCGVKTPFYVISKGLCANICPSAQAVAPSLPMPSLPLPPMAVQPATVQPTTVQPTTSTKAASTCATITAGTCQLMGCSTSRGDVKCNKDYKCECKPGLCVDNNGKCSAPGSGSFSAKKK